MLFLTGSETAFFVPGGVVVGAAITFWATRRSARDVIQGQLHVAELTLSSQRRLAADQWLRQRRSKLYVTVLDAFSVSTLESMVRDEQNDVKNRETATELVTLFIYHNTSMQLFAGNKVVDLWREVGQQAFKCMRAAAAVQRAGAGSGDSTDEELTAGQTAEQLLRSSLVAAAFSATKLGESMRLEIQDAVE